jgi:hypothetical protein
MGGHKFVVQDIAKNDDKFRPQPFTKRRATTRLSHVRRIVVSEQRLREGTSS